ncbi:IS1182 family transposase [Dactylosporangium matsuzakiense]|uniref:IS1182 family transposase n=1 Tax=Dactylosporangium matsuzakiense TaxID=53360 RepID=UPI0021C310BE|nr:IS1182 family transposase [Dactylosporangium matsuzakiense]UWZ42294.1 IS1182 family transposase [Dactylosporangium matsuzakiense]UWZ46862.1 IS1182 family transposase [Dactylosporangium matsuzakiense]
MALGRASQQVDLLDPVSAFCGAALPGNSIFAFLHEHRDTLFPDGMFADLFAAVGRRSVPPSVVAVVMVLQRLEGLSDREAVDRFTFDARWRYAAGVGGWGGAGRAGFAHTVLVDMRERLRRSDRPDRIFEVALAAARNAGLIGRRRVLDSTPLYDAVATMDTITLIRSAIRGLLSVAGPGLTRPLRAVLAGAASGDDYTSTAKPVIDWDDKPAREALVDSRARDGHALLDALDGREDLPEPVAEAMQLLATVLGQDLETGPDGTLRIARKVAADRVISTVDPQARHGHKTNHRGFDGYKGHIALDPDSEIVTATAVTAGNTGDVEPAAGLITDLTGDPNAGPATVYGDAAYGAGEILHRLDRAGIDAKTKVQPPVAPAGKFTKDRFIIDLDQQQVTCPNGTVVPIRPVKDHTRRAGKADFGAACATCPLRAQCTDAKTGRSITIGHHETRLTAARTRQQDPAWQADYRATRPKVERKLAHLMRRRHGGRRARMRGQLRIAADFTLLAAAINLARLATLGLTRTSRGWTLHPT